MRFTLQEVEHIAQLAHLSLSKDQKSLYCLQLSSILEYAESLAKLDTDAIPPTFAISPTSSVMRTDDPRESMPREALLSNAPETAESMFRVPRILTRGQ